MWRSITQLGWNEGEFLKSSRIWFDCFLRGCTCVWWRLQKRNFSNSLKENMNNVNGWRVNGCGICWKSLRITLRIGFTCFLLWYRCVWWWFGKMKILRELYWMKSFQLGKVSWKTLGSSPGTWLDCSLRWCRSVWWRLKLWSYRAVTPRPRNLLQPNQKINT